MVSWHSPAVRCPSFLFPCLCYCTEMLPSSGEQPIDPKGRWSCSPAWPVSRAPLGGECSCGRVSPSTRGCRASTQQKQLLSPFCAGPSWKFPSNAMAAYWNSLTPAVSSAFTGRWKTVILNECSVLICLSDHKPSKFNLYDYFLWPVVLILDMSSRF